MSHGLAIEAESRGVEHECNAYCEGDLHARIFYADGGMVLMSRDVVVTVPMKEWADWIAEGGLPDEEVIQDYYFTVPTLPRSSPGNRVYVVSYGRLRGYSPLIRIQVGRDPELGEAQHPWIALVRRGGAVAVTLPEHIAGFRGFRYRWWERNREIPFPDWRNVP